MNSFYVQRKGNLASRKLKNVLNLNLLVIHYAPNEVLATMQREKTSHWK